MKFIKIKFSNGDRFSIPAGVVANSRAKYYADHDEGKLTDDNIKEWNEAFYKEIEYTLSDDYELTDWLWNNMDWVDVKDRAEKLQDKETEYDYEDHWNEISENEDNVEVVNE